MFNRHFYRVNFVTKAKVDMPDQSFDCTTENVSYDGLFVLTDHQLPVGRIATINLNLPSASHKYLTVKGEVVRNSPRGAAFHFKSVDYETFSYLRNVLKDRMSHTGNGGLTY